MSFSVGTSGYSFPFWGPTNLGLKNYYPNKTTTKWLSVYAKDFKSVEINCTRYRKLTPAMCQKWLTQVPSDFKFTIKASTYITHMKKLCDFKEWWDEFYKCIIVLNDNFESVLFQFPPTFKCTESNVLKIRNVKSIIPINIRCAFEFRDLGWYEDNIISLDLFSGNWCQVVVCTSALQTEELGLPGGVHIGQLNSNFMYIRFHGPGPIYCGTYGYEKLVSVTGLIKSVNPLKCCIYFNNTDSWTMLPYHNVEAPYSEYVVKNKQITPSSVYDGIIMRKLVEID